MHKFGGEIRTWENPLDMISSTLIRRAGALISLSRSNGGRFGWRRQSGRLISTSSSPWLMLPPSASAYNFYNPAEGKVIGINNKGVGMREDAKLVGSSHGWLALYNQESDRAVFLTNPMSGRHVDLPRIDDEYAYLNIAGEVYMRKLLISHSPDDKDCVAMTIYAPRSCLAFCRPGDAQWTCIGDLASRGDDGNLYARQYEEFVYSNSLRLFFCLTTDEEMEAWDFTSSPSPKMVWRVRREDLDYDDANYPWSGRTELEAKLREADDPDAVFHPRYLVSDERSGQLLLLSRHVVWHMDTNGWYIKEIDRRFPSKTIGFDVHRVDREKGSLIHMEASLDGLSIYVGQNHTMAVVAAEYPGLKPNCIYFTTSTSNPCGDFGGHDNGIFNYEDATIEPCYYPCHHREFKKIHPSPLCRRRRTATVNNWSKVYLLENL